MVTRYKPESITPAISSWTNVSGASDSGETKLLNPGGKISFKLINAVNRGLDMSRYIQVVARFTATIDPNYNYGKSIDIIMSGYFTDGTDTYGFYYDIPVTDFSSTSSGGDITVKSEVDMSGLTIGACTIYVVNNTTNIVAVKSCLLHKSVDINNTQVADQTQGQIDTTLGGIIDYTLLKSINFRSSGFTATYDNKVLDFSYVYDGGNLVGLQSTGGRLINITYS